MRPTMILAAAALGGLLAASSTSRAYALGCTFTDIDVPGSQPGSTSWLPLGKDFWSRKAIGSSGNRAGGKP
jgi:hypothetical protein